MNLIDYIKGDRKGKEAHRLEKESMSDPFLSEAIEGFESVKGNHIERIARIKKDIGKRKTKKKVARRINSWTSISAAAAVLLLVAIGSLLYINNSSVPKPVTTPEPESPLAINNAIDNEPDSSETTTKTEQYQTSGKEYVRFTPPSIRDYSEEFKESSSGGEKAIISMQRTVQDEDESISKADRIARHLSEIITEGVIDATKKELDNKTTSDQPLFYTKDYTDTEINIAMNAGHNQAKPIGGFVAYQRYIKKNIVRPEGDKNRGEVTLIFSTNDDGEPINISIIKSLNEECDYEAERLLKEGPKWRQKDKSVFIIYTIKF